MQNCGETFIVCTKKMQKMAKNCTKKMQNSHKTAQKECNYDINGLSDDIFIAGRFETCPYMLQPL